MMLWKYHVKIWRCLFSFNKIINNSIIRYDSKIITNNNQNNDVSDTMAESRLTSKAVYSYLRRHQQLTHKIKETKTVQKIAVKP